MNVGPNWRVPDFASSFASRTSGYYIQKDKGKLTEEEHERPF